MTLAAFAVDEFRDYVKELRRLQDGHEESVKLAKELDKRMTNLVDYQITNYSRVLEKLQEHLEKVWMKRSLKKNDK